MIELQKLVFDKKPIRKVLLEYVPQSCATVKISIYRNHSFELVEHTIAAYLDYAGLKADFSYSDYDDSLSFANLNSDADLMILWLDINRYKVENIESFIKARIEYLQGVFSKPILFVPLGATFTLDSGTVVTFSLEGIEKELGDSFLDMRMEPFTGTKLSSKALLYVSRELGLRFIPAVTQVALKAIVCDLDNTLYKGILGEDGVNGIELTDGHRRLQEQLKALANSGRMLCIASKNEAADVERLFELRKDFPLKREDFTVVAASWEPKSTSVNKIISRLNIGTSSVLFIDDNPGEIAAMQSAFSDIKVLLASENGEETDYMLSKYPGMLKFGVNKEDALRKCDIQANEMREQLSKSLSMEDYIKSLDVTLTMHIDVKDDIQRISELANKTNQFIFNYKRYTPKQVEALMLDPNATVVDVALSDKLSDSGIIAVCVGKKMGDCVDIEECFVSCRALGRGIDDVIVLGMLDEILYTQRVTKLKVEFTKGERNTPAEKFVDKYLNGYVNSAKEKAFTINENFVKIIKKRG